MKIRISLPENRDFAGHLEVVGASGAVVFGPVPAAGRAHDELAAVHGNVSRSPLRPYGDTPLGTYAVRGVVEPSEGSGPDGESLGTEGTVLLEPASGQAALADAHGRFRLFIQGGDDDAGLCATAGGVRLRDRDLKQLVALVRRAPERVQCEIVATAQQGAKVSLARTPRDRDPPALPGRLYVWTRPPAKSLSPSLASTAGSRAAAYSPRMFVVPEHSGAAGGTEYGGGGDEGAGTGADTGASGPSDTGVGSLPISGVDVAPAPGVDLNPPPDQTDVTIAQAGGSQLLSTAPPTGLSNPYSPEQGGWVVGPSPNNPFTDSPAGGPLAQFAGTEAGTYSGGPPDDGKQNSYTGGPPADAYFHDMATQLGGTFEGYDEEGRPVISISLSGRPEPNASPAPDPGQNYTPVTDPGQNYTPATPQRDTTNDSDAAIQEMVTRFAQYDADLAASQAGQPQPANAPAPDPNAPPAPAPGQNYTPANAPGQRDTINDPDAAIQEMVTRFTQYDADLAASQAGQPQPANAPGQNFSTPGVSDLRPPDSPSAPLSRFVSAVPGGLGVGSLFAPQPNWYYRGLAGWEPTIADIQAGADLVPHPINPGRTYVQGTPAEMTFRQTRPGAVNAQGLPVGPKFTLGTDRISTAGDLDAFISGPLQNRGTGELTRIDVDLLRRLGGQFYEPEELLRHLDAIEANLNQQLADLNARAANGEPVNTALKKVQYDLGSVDRARAHVNAFQEGEGVGSIPSRAISEVPGASLPEAAAREARFLQGLEVARGLGEGFLVVGAAISVERVLTAPPDQTGRVLAEEGGGWAFSFAAAGEGAEVGLALGAAFGIETGPGAIITGAIGGLIGGAFGFFTGQVIGGAAYSGLESSTNWLIDSMVQGQIEQDQAAARRGSTTGELPPTYIDRGPTGDPFNDAFLFP
jgi:hypothetical protein